jgi:hypothetical protein
MVANSISALWLFLVDAGLNGAGEHASRGVDHTDQLAGRSLEQAKQLRAQDVEGREIGECQQIFVLEALTIQVAKMNGSFGELGGESLEHFRRSGDILLPGDNRHLTGKGALLKIGQAGFLRRDTEDRVLHDVNFGTGGAKALAKLGEVRDGETAIIENNEKRRGVETVDVLLADKLLFGTHLLILSSDGLCRGGELAKVQPNRRAHRGGNGATFNKRTFHAVWT